MENFTILGLLGPAGSGKDLVADWFWVEKGFVKVAFADPMKRFAQKAFGIDTKTLWGPSELRNVVFEVSEAWWFDVIGRFNDASEEIVNNVLEVGFRTDGFLRLHDWLTNLRKDHREKISARVILQTLGTEWGRAVDPTMWTKYAYRTIDTIQKGGMYQARHGIEYLEPANTPPGVVIPDHRFRNEVGETQMHDGKVIRLRRLALEKKVEESVGVAGHQSEAEQKELPDSLFNLVLEFPEGVDKVYEVLKHAYDTKAWMAQWPPVTKAIEAENRL